MGDDAGGIGRSTPDGTQPPEERVLSDAAGAARLPADIPDGPSPDADLPLADSVAERRRLAEVRCEFAEGALREADAAEARLHELHEERERRRRAVAGAEAGLDTGAIQTAKEGAHQLFRRAVRGAHSRRDVEVAAAAWLAEINSINAGVSAARQRIERERAYAAKLGPEVASASSAAASARAVADNAAEACSAARAALAAAEAREARAAAVAAEAAAVAGRPAGPEAARLDAVARAAVAAIHAARSETPGDVVAETPGRVAEVSGQAPADAPITTPSAAPSSTAAPAPAPPPAKAGPSAPAARPLSAAGRWAAFTAIPALPDPDDGTDRLRIELAAAPPCVMLRLLRRDARAMTRLVARVAGPKPSEQSRVQILVSELVDAVFAAAIDAAFFVFPPDDPFWRLFSKEQSRDIVRGLAALGHRYDGMGGFADGRLPTVRDLSLALGHAGLNPTRIRVWPDRDEIAGLYRGLRIEADAFVAERAPSLTLGELVRLLGRRAERLTDLWNDWARIRPLLLAPD